MEEEEIVWPHVVQLPVQPSAVDAKKSKKKVKKVVDNSIPRKPKNPFYYFCRSERSSIVEEQGRDMTADESTKLLSIKWNTYGFVKKRNTTLFEY